MCKDCGCSITDNVKRDSHNHGEGHSHEHNHGDSHSHQEAHAHLHDNPQLNDPKTISVITKILDKNDQEAGHNRHTKK